MSGLLADASCRIAIEGLISGVLAGTTYGQHACIRGVRGCAGISQRGPLQSTLLPLIISMKLSLMISGMLLLNSQGNRTH